MNKRGNGSKLVYGETVEGIQIKVGIQYNPRTDHITYGLGYFQKSQGRNNGSAYNKNCPIYLGVTIAEQLLAKVFKNVKRMPNCNQGFDIICNQGYKIDIKSSTRSKNRNGWIFNINHNKIADYFLYLAFDDRKNLNPLHIWLIPSKEINYLIGLRISESKLDKWSKYELTDKLDKVIGCCNIMKEK